MVTGGKAAEARHAFKEAQESYEQALVLVALLAESPERDLRELELRQWIVRALFITRGYSAPETVEAAQQAARLAEKSGNLRLFANLIILLGVSVINRDSSTARALADQALELAVREGSPSVLGPAQMLQVIARYDCGDLAGAEQHFTAGLEFFNHLSLMRIPTFSIAVLNYASCTAWTQGRSDVARDRMTKMMAAANESNPYEVAFAAHFAAQLRSWLKEHEQAKELAAQALELSEKHRFVELAALARCFLGLANAHLGLQTKGILLIRQGIDELVEAGDYGLALSQTLLLAIAQACDGGVVDALKTVEHVLRNKSELLFRPEALRLRGELWLKQEQKERALADFREAIAFARSM
jgi:tetratricopeptide (TPR) repeat protein